MLQKGTIQRDLHDLEVWQVFFSILFLISINYKRKGSFWRGQVIISEEQFLHATCLCYEQYEIV